MTALRSFCTAEMDQHFLAAFQGLSVFLKPHSMLLIALKLLIDMTDLLSRVERGTGLAGGAVPCDAPLVISTTKMNSILEVNYEKRFAWVGPGVVNKVSCGSGSS